ncbi:MAG: hypothetical protein IKA79_03770, partial [Lentisphaeria bacterium]|nr:hypothetical protein [Lentisphaeria bacterium]
NYQEFAYLLPKSNKMPTTGGNATKAKKSGAEITRRKSSFSVTPILITGQRRMGSITGKTPGMNFLPEKMC